MPRPRRPRKADAPAPPGPVSVPADPAASPSALHPSPAPDAPLPGLEIAAQPTAGEGTPTFPQPVPIPDIRPDQVPPPGPGEAPDTADDTANVPLNTLVWLKGCKAVLLAEGFKRDPLRQARKPGQVWGVVRQEPEDMQIHVRAFKDGRLESEVELSNRYIQHLWSHRRGAHVEVKEILARHGMPTTLVSETFQPLTGTKAGKIMPSGRTKTTHVIAAGLVTLGAWAAWRLATRRLRR